MADVATPSAAKMSTIHAGADKAAPKGEKKVVDRPERPDEEAYKTELAKAEKELKAAEERMVSKQASPAD
jgi:hypothetical protein